ncbi:hypothetical protein [Paenibacillus gansuensis]|uniref:Histidine-rich glycoprotein-like n=1 Tax=Paenibacillus gansuensis TaxID=306542 RepID=A0ABW5PES6_9BACL
MLKHLLQKLLHSLLGSKSGHHRPYRHYKHSSSDYKHQRPVYTRHSSSDFGHKHHGHGHKHYKNRYGSSS